MTANAAENKQSNIYKVFTKCLKVVQKLIQFNNKRDGAPAVFVGTDPVDGKFFVGTKVFNKRKLVNKSIQDIRANHEAEGLQEKLISSFYTFTKIKF